MLTAAFSLADISAATTKGIWFDFVTAGLCLLPIACYHLLLPAGRHGSHRDRICDTVLRVTFIFVMLFDATAEHLYWSEFSTRFNFIAVDYLVYTHEVIGNIIESYPLHWLLVAIGVGALFITRITLRIAPLAPANNVPITIRAASVAVFIGVCMAMYVASSHAQSQIKGNALASEVASNGLYNLFYSFWNNEIDYGRFYLTRSDSTTARAAHELLLDSTGTFVNDDGKDFTRIIRPGGNEKHQNVMLVVMESLSADYMGTFGNTEGLTPRLDRLAEEGLLFSNLYATGTRTVRGLEALTLSIPPTPGQSIIRRPENSDLYSLGYVFRDRGYDTKFIYGGYGYFDNMNAFFAGNGFDILDRTQMSRDNITFANVWGVCDEDLFAQAIHEADRAYTAGKPFMYLLMTTSNHRPFTYPEGRIDIPSHSGRYGGVKYADFSIGKLLEDARTRPWFRDTVFVFVADHTAGAGGKAELDPAAYHIPMIFYAPGRIAPRRYEQMASQIDMAPTLLDILNFGYFTKFYGRDLLHGGTDNPHAFISNYQKVALLTGSKLTVLAPKRQVEQFRMPEMTAIEPAIAHDIDEAVTYYQSASWWREQYKRVPTVLKPQ